MQRLRLLATLVLLAAWVPTVDPDLTTLVMTSDAAVIAKRVGDHVHEGRTIGTYKVVHAVHGTTPGTIVIDDAMYRHPDEDPVRLLFLSRLSAADQARWKLPEWIVSGDGARIVVKGVVHDFHAEDARFTMGSGTYVDGGRSIMVMHAQTRDDPAFDAKKPGPVMEAELLDAAKRAVARAAELCAVLKLPADTRRRSRLLALLPAPRPAGMQSFRMHVQQPELVDAQIMRALIDANDSEGILEALPRLRYEDGSWQDVLLPLARDLSQPDSLRVRVIAVADPNRGAFTDLLVEPSIAIRTAVASRAIASPCLHGDEKKQVDRAVRIEKDPGVRALLRRADRKRECPRH